MDVERSLAEKVGTHQALHYDLGKHVMTLSPAPLIDEALGFEGEVARRKPLTFESISDISISSKDNLVIGKIVKFSNEFAGGRHHCEIVFDDFGTEILVRFSFDRVL